MTRGKISGSAAATPLSKAETASTPKADSGEDSVLEEQFTREFQAILRQVKDARGATGFSADGDIDAESPEIAYFGAISQRLLAVVNKLLHRTDELAPRKKEAILLTFGDKFADAHEYRAARRYFYQKVSGLWLDAAQRDFSKPKSETYVRAMYGAAVCEFQVAKYIDPFVRYPGTLEKLVAALRMLQSGMETAMELERKTPHQFAWLLLNGSVLMYSIAKPLSTLGYEREVVPFLKWCLLALQSAVVLSTTKYILWRLQIYVAVSECLESLAVKRPKKAGHYLQAFSQCVDHAQQIVGRLRKEEELDTPLPKNVLSVLINAETIVGMLVARSRALVKGEPFGRKNIEAVADASTRLRLTLDSLEKASTRPADEASELLSLAMEMIEPTVAPLLDSTTNDSDVSPEVLLQLDRDLPVPLHMQILRCAYSLRRMAEMEKLLEQVRLRVCTGTEADVIRLELSLFESLSKLSAVQEEESRGEQYQSIARALKAWSSRTTDRVSTTMRDFISSVALRLWNEFARQIIHRLDSQPPPENGDVPSTDVLSCVRVLEAIYVSLTKVDTDDMLLLGEVCQRLCLLLHVLHDRRKAIRFARDCVARIDSFRDQIARASTHFQSLSAAMRKSISAATFSFDMPVQHALSDCEDQDSVQATGRRAVGVRGSGSQCGAVYQEVACVQVDLLLVIFKLEMEEISTIESIRLSGSPPPAAKPQGVKARGSSALDSALQKEFKKNLYALVLVNVERIRRSEARDDALTLAADCLQMLRKVEIQERDLLKMIDTSASQETETTVPRAPRILMRSSTAIAVEIIPFRPSVAAARRRTIAYYMVFAKPSGAGTDVSLNNAEYPGTGEPVDPGGPFEVTVSGLAPNVSYVFAVAAFDALGEVIQGIGETCKPVAAVNPLPLIACYGYLAQACFSQELLEPARKAAKYVYDAVVSTDQASCAGWASNFFYRHALQRSVLARWPLPLLTLVVQSILVLCDVEDGDSQRDGQLVASDGSVLARRHVAILEASKMIAVGVEVATAAADLEQIRMLCFKGYRVLLPLLHLDDANALTFAALVTLYQALRCTPTQLWDTDTRSIASRLAFELMRIAWRHRHLTNAVYLQIAHIKEHGEALEPGEASSTEMRSLLDAIAMAECSLGRPLATSSPSSPPTSASSTVSSPAKAAAKATPVPAAATSPQASPRDDEASLPPLSDLINQSKLVPRDTFKLLEPHLKTSRESLEAFCKLCSCMLETADEGVLIDEWIALVKVKGRIGTEFKETLRSVGLEQLLPPTEEASQAAPVSAPSTARATGKTPRPAETPPVDTPQRAPTPEPAVGEDDEYLFLWCGELCLIQAKMLYRALQRQRSTSTSTVDYANGPQYDLAFETLQLAGSSSATKDTPAPSLPKEEAIDSNQPTEATEGKSLFHRLMDRVAASCRLFVRARAWQALQTAAQYAVDAIWLEWVSPTTIGGSLSSLTTCVDALVEMIDLVTTAIKEEQATSTTTEPPTSTAIDSAPRTISMASTTVVLSAMSTVNTDQTWISNLVSFTIQSLLYHSQWHKMVEIGKKYHLLSGGSSRFSEKMLPILVYAQQRYVDEQKTRLDAANESLASFVKAFMDAEAKKKKKKSRLVVEEVLTPEEIEFRRGKEEREAAIRELSAEYANRQAELETLQRMHSSVARTTNKVVQALDACHELVEKHQRLGETVVKQQQIMSAYLQCAALGRQKRTRRLVGKALQELGDFLWAKQDPKGAIKYWNEAIDNAFNTLRATSSWREVVLADQPEIVDSDALIEGDGFWTCLESCTAMMKLILVDDGASAIGASAVEVARLAAGVLTRILTKCSLPHPSLAYLYGSYEVVSQVWPGRELLLDGERLDATRLGSTFVTVIQVLLQYDQPVEAMPVLAVYEHVALQAVEDVNHVANARHLRMDALSQCGRFHDAFTQLASLLHGVKIEQTPTPRETNPFLDKLDFHDAKPIKDAANAAFLSWLSAADAANLYADLIAMYNRETSRRILLSVVRVLLRLAEQEPVEDEMNAPVRQHASRLATGLVQLLQQHLQELEAMSEPTSSQWETLTVHFLVAEAMLVQGQVAFTGCQWARARKHSDEAIDVAAQVQARVDSVLAQRSASESPTSTLLSLDNELPSAFIHKPSTVAIRARLLRVKCDLAQRFYQQALELITHAIDEAHRSGEQLHFVRHLELLRAQALVKLGSSAVAFDDLVSLRQDFVASHSTSSIEYVRLLRITAALLRDQAVLDPIDPSTKLGQALQILDQAEVAIDELLRLDGWIGTENTTSDDMRMNLYHPAVPDFVKLKAEIARSLVETPVSAAVEVALREQRALKAIDVALKAIDHTTATLTPVKAQLLVLKGAILKKKLLADASTNREAALNDCVATFLASIHEAIHVTGCHDRVLIRTAFIELVDLYGAKLVPGQEAEHVQAAFHYLSLALVAQSFQQVLFDSLELQSATLANADKLPAFLAEAMLDTYGDSSKPSPPPPVQAAPGKGGAPVPADASKRPAVDAARAINFFIKLIRDIETLPACAAMEQSVAIFQHNFLVQNHATYPKICCFTTVAPVPMTDPEIKAGLIAAHWQRDITPALTSQAAAPLSATVTLFFTLGTTRIASESSTRPSTAAEGDQGDAALLRDEKFATAPILSRRAGINEHAVRKLRDEISRLRIDIEDDDSLTIDKSTFQASFDSILRSTQRLFRNEETRPNSADETSHATTSIMDASGRPIPLACSLELVKVLESLFHVDRGVHSVDNGLCYFLRDLLDN